MNYLIQRGKVRGQVINVPEGLPELLSDITREVLRCQPTTECLCQFVIDYLHSVIVTREKARMAKQIIDRALHTVDEIISDLCICDITKEKTDQMALLMEECFRRFLEKRRCERNKQKEIVKFNEEDMLDELIKRCRFSDQELKMSRPMIEAAYNRFVEAYMKAQEGTEGTEALYQYFKSRELKRQEEYLQNAAAIKIQSNYRGYIVRARMSSIKHMTKLSYEEKIEDHMNNWEEQDKAARKIQKFYRNHIQTQTRVSDMPQEICEPASIASVRPSPPPEMVEVLPEAAVESAPPPAENEEQPAMPEAEPEPPTPSPEPTPEPEASMAAPIEAPVEAETPSPPAEETGSAALAEETTAESPPDETQE